jgi:hypothetical protein
VCVGKEYFTKGFKKKEQGSLVKKVKYCTYKNKKLLRFTVTSFRLASYLL